MFSMCQEAGVWRSAIDFGQLRLRPALFFDFGQFRLRPISTSANFVFGLFRFRPIFGCWILGRQRVGPKGWSPKPGKSGAPGGGPKGGAQKGGKGGAQKGGAQKGGAQKGGVHKGGAPKGEGPEGWRPKRRKSGARRVDPRRVEPRRVDPRRVDPRREPEGWGAQNFALFFPSSRHNFLSSFSLWGSFRGILVVFEAPGALKCARLGSRAVVWNPGGPIVRSRIGRSRASSFDAAQHGTRTWNHMQVGWKRETISHCNSFPLLEIILNHS